MLQGLYKSMRRTTPTKKIGIENAILHFKLTLEFKQLVLAVWLACWEIRQFYLFLFISFTNKLHIMSNIKGTSYLPQLPPQQNPQR